MLFAFGFMLLANNPHILRIPVYYFILEIAVVACQTRRCGPEAKHSIFNNGLTCPDGIYKIRKMLVRGVITRRNPITYVGD